MGIPVRDPRSDLAQTSALDAPRHQGRSPQHGRRDARGVIRPRALAPGPPHILAPQNARATHEVIDAQKTRGHPVAQRLERGDEALTLRHHEHPSLSLSEFDQRRPSAWLMARGFRQARAFQRAAPGGLGESAGAWRCDHRRIDVALGERTAEVGRAVFEAKFGREPAGRLGDPPRRHGVECCPLFPEDLRVDRQWLHTRPDRCPSGRSPWSRADFGVDHVIARSRRRSATRFSQARRRQAWSA